MIPLIDTIQLLDISDEEYFSSKWSDYISNSKLSLINPEQGGSPEMYLEGLDKNAKYSDSLTFGSAVHALTLQPDEYEVAEGVERPTAKMGAMADELYRLYKDDRPIKDEDVINASNKIDYYKSKMSDSKIQAVFDKCKSYWDDRLLWESVPTDKTPIYLDLRSREKLASCMTSIENNREIQSLLHPTGLIENPISKNEATLIMHVKAEVDNKEVILKLKAKLDNFTYDVETNTLVLNDLKTTGHLLKDFKGSFDTFHYNRQLAMYLWMLRLYIMKEYGIKEFNEVSSNILLISTVPEYRSGVMKVSKNEIEKGFKEFRELLTKVARLIVNGYDGSVESNV